MVVMVYFSVVYHVYGQVQSGWLIWYGLVPYGMVRLVPYIGILHPGVPRHTMEHSMVLYGWLDGMVWFMVQGMVQYGWLVVQALADTRSISCTIVWLRDTKSLIDTLKSWTLGQTRKDQ